MYQHQIQKAHFEPFLDRGELWVHPKDGKPPFRRPASWCTAEKDFQSERLEADQNRLVESPGIQVLRRLLGRPNILSESEFERICQWVALHLIRNTKMRMALGESGEDYEAQFADLFEKEIRISKYFRFVKVCSCNASNFFITSDNPVTSFVCDGNIVQLLPLSPSKLIQFSSRDGKFEPEESFEDFVNSMIWAGAVEFVFSDRRDLDIAKYKRIAEKWEMIPRLEEQHFLSTDTL
jgi:hypothetical protein